MTKTNKKEGFIMKKVFALVLALIMILSLAACGAGEKKEKTTEELYVWSIVPKADGVFWGSMQQGVEDFLKEKGITEYRLAAPAEVANVQQQIELCEAAISAGADILILRISDPEAFMDVIQRAVKNGITVYSFQESPKNGIEEYCTAWCGISPEMLGQAQAEAVAAGVKAGKVAEDATVFYLSPTLTNPTHITNCESFVKALSEAYPNMTIITDETGSGQPATVAAELVDAYLLSNPEISVMVANGANETSVMAAKVEGINAYDDLWVVGCDGGEEQAEMLYIGSLDVTVCQDTYGVGYNSAKNALTIHQGGTVDFYTPVGCELLFPEGVKEYCEKGGWDMTAWNSYKG